MTLDDLVVDQCSRRLPPASLGLPRLRSMCSGLDGDEILPRETSLKPLLPCDLCVGLAKGGQRRGGRATVWLDQDRTRLLWRSRWFNYHPIRGQSPPECAFTWCSSAMLPVVSPTSCCGGGQDEVIRCCLTKPARSRITRRDTQPLVRSRLDQPSRAGLP